MNLKPIPHSHYLKTEIIEQTKTKAEKKTMRKMYRKTQQEITADFQIFFQTRLVM